MSEKTAVRNTPKYRRGTLVLIISASGYLFPSDKKRDKRVIAKEKEYRAQYIGRVGMVGISWTPKGGKSRIYSILGTTQDYLGGRQMMGLFKENELCRHNKRGEYGVFKMYRRK
ncbi:hypothetical protein LCGC14_2770240 [marine sediment metagenome]|uniref:Uncharacterized protein n=1 Tax=marine sediment metagenome TaxID=412755 RepID=A0A0F9BMX6_9ZZZZ